MWIHLGYEHVIEEDLYGQFHSKVILIERTGESPCIVVGSHNWTKNALRGHNLEASIILTGEESDAIVSDVRQHILACRTEHGEEFKPNRLAYYQQLQFRYHPKVSQPKISWQHIPSAGFSRFRALIILAEDHTDGGLNDSGVVWIRIPADWQSEEKPTTDTLIWLLLFENGSLFERRQRLVRSCHLQGTPDTISRNPSRVTASPMDYLIDNIQEPCVRRSSEKPELETNQEWAVVPFTKADQLELLPLFHAEEKYPGWDIRDDLLPDIGKECKPITGDSPLSKPYFRVPFLFLYPGTAKESVEKYQLREYVGANMMRYAVKFKEVRNKVSPHVCFVQYRSDAELTEAIHNSQK